MSDDETQQTMFPARVIEVVSPFVVAINRGARHGVKIGQKFIVYGLSERDMIDPETKENLGRLEIVRGRGTVTHVQDRMATIESTRRGERTRTVVKRRNMAQMLAMGTDEEIIENPGDELPFADPEEDDYARPV